MFLTPGRSGQEKVKGETVEKGREGKLEKMALVSSGEVLMMKWLEVISKEDVFLSLAPCSQNTALLMFCYSWHTHGCLEEVASLMGLEEGTEFPSWVCKC